MGARFIKGINSSNKFRFLRGLNTSEKIKFLNTASVTQPTFPADYIAFWKLSDGTDSSPNANDLTNWNDVQFVAGKIGDCAQFDATNFLLSTNNISPIFNPDDGVGEFTVSCWINPASFSNYQAFLGSSPGFIIHTDQNGDLYCNEATSGDAQINGILSLNIWQHIVFVKSNASGYYTKVWYNGTKVYDEPTQNAENYSAVVALALGAFYSNESTETSYPYDGKLDMVGLWNRELNENEIAALYNNGSGLEP